MSVATPPGINIAMQKQTQARVRGPEPEVQIFVKNLNGKTMALMISPTDTVESLMKKVQERTDIPPSEQRILYGGKQLVPEKILADYNISKESTLHLGKWTLIERLCFLCSLTQCIQCFVYEEGREMNDGYNSIIPFFQFYCPLL
jgi:hypothetical protein